MLKLSSQLLNCLDCAISPNHSVFESRLEITPYNHSMVMIFFLGNSFLPHFSRRISTVALQQLSEILVLPPGRISAEKKYQQN